MINEVINEYIDAKVKGGLIKEKCRDCFAGGVSIPYDCHGMMFGVSYRGCSCNAICKDDSLTEGEYRGMMNDISNYVLMNRDRINQEAKKKKVIFEAESKALMLASEKKGFLSRLFGL